MTYHFAGYGELGEEIVSRLAERMTEEDRHDLTLYAWEEEKLFADELAAMLVLRQVPIVAAERELIVELLGYFSLPGMDFHHYPYIADKDRTLAALNVVDQP